MFRKVILFGKVLFRNRIGSVRTEQTGKYNRKERNEQIWIYQYIYLPVLWTVEKLP